MSKTNYCWHWSKAREYRSQFHIATSWGLHETTVGRIIKKVEDILVKCGKFRLPSKRHLYQPGWEWKVLVVDVGDSGNRTSKKKQKRYYSGKQKCHKIKSQLLIEFETGQMICTAIGTGRMHDFKLFKRSRIPFASSQLCLADRGYQGFGRQHPGACTPSKKPGKQALPKAEKQHNRTLSSLRVRVEHVIRRFKIFRMFSLALSQSWKAVWITLESHCRSAQL